MTKENEIKLIRYYLKKSERSAIRDRVNFESLLRGEIDVTTCKYRFFQSNEVPYKITNKISDDSFESWVRSLGYRDGLQDIQE